MKRVVIAVAATLILGGLSPIVSAAGRADTDPVAIKEVSPDYPKAALKDRKEGSVLVAVEVLPNGKVGTARVTQSLSPVLDAEAVKAAKQWRFKPATKDGKPVKVETTLEMTFSVKT